MEDESRIRQILEEAVAQAMTYGEETPVSENLRTVKPEPEVPKPEHMTHLRDNHLVYKDHPRIAFRGAIDSLESEIILFQTITEQRGLDQLTRDLEEIIKAIRWLLRCEVSGEPVGEVTLQGLNTDELRAHSHHPSQYYGIRHFLPTHKHGEIVAYLNRLRTRTRETELAAYRAFKTETGDVEREDIIRVLNRLSSLFWIMMFKYLKGMYGGTYED